MMKVEELRVCNLVHLDNQILTVSISSVEFAHRFEPIQLTEEWLIKLGFKFETEFFNFKKEEFIINLFKHKVKGISHAIFMINEYGITINYVHQLQNLYYALTGKELNLK